MENLIDDAAQYIDSIFDVDTVVQKSTHDKSLSLLIRNQYQCYETEILNESLILVVARNVTSPSPAAIRKHFKQIKSATGLMPVYLCPETTAYARKELIKNQIPFIVPDNQLYLPFLGINLKEHYTTKQMEQKNEVSTVAQLVLLFHFHNPDVKDLTPSSLAGKLGYSRMSLSRAVRELENLKLCRLDKLGNKNLLGFPETGYELWKRSLPYFRSPIKKIVSLAPNANVSDEFYLSGLSLLSRFSMINPGNHAVYAMSLSHFNAIAKKSPWNLVPNEAAQKLELQLWRYNPALFADGKHVDKLSLYLSLRDNPDERIESALDELLEEFEW